MFLLLQELIEKASWKFPNDKIADKWSKVFKVKFIANKDGEYRLTDCYNPLIQVLPQLLSKNFMLLKRNNHLEITLII